MKTFEIQIKKNRSAKECSFTWPTWWGEVNEGVDVVAYEDNPKAFGGHSEGAVCVCDNSVWDIIAAKNDKDIMELTETTANEKGREWRPQVTKITDQNKVLELVSKVALGKTLTAKEKKVLDPDDPTQGIGKSELFDVAKIAKDKGDVLSEASIQA